MTAGEADELLALAVDLERIGLAAHCVPMQGEEYLPAVPHPFLRFPPLVSAPLVALGMEVGHRADLLRRYEHLGHGRADRPGWIVQGIELGAGQKNLSRSVFVVTRPVGQAGPVVEDVGEGYAVRVYGKGDVADHGVELVNGKNDEPSRCLHGSLLKDNTEQCIGLQYPSLGNLSIPILTGSNSRPNQVQQHYR